MSSSHDKSLRLWERTREPLILEEEREMVRTLALVIGVLVGVRPLSQLVFFLVQSHLSQYKFKDSRKRIPRLLSPFQQPGRDGCH